MLLFEFKNLFQKIQFKESWDVLTVNGAKCFTEFNQDHLIKEGLQNCVYNKEETTENIS